MAVATQLVRCALIALGLCLSATAAWAQPRRLPVFRPEVSVGLSYEDNVFRRPVPTSDLILRVSPNLELRRESTKLTLGAHYRLDAERYTENPVLTTAVARQSTGLDLVWRPNSRATFSVAGGYHRTETPQDLNLSTGLSLSRQRASRREVAGSVQYAVHPSTSLTFGFDYGVDEIAAGIGSQVRSGLARFTRRLGARDVLSLTYRYEERQFDPGAPILSHLGLVAWSHRLTSDLSLTLEGGPRQSGGDLAPEIIVSLTRQIGGLTNLAVTYAHTQGIAIGVAGLVAVDSVATSVTIRRSRRWEVIAGGGAYRNVLSGSPVFVYGMNGSIGRALGRSIWLVGNVSRSLSENVSGGVIPLDQEIRQNVVGLSLRVAPWSSR
jgi:hypothetical protein